MSERTPLEKEIRKLRKKLRQIEHLETIDRELNEEEWTKVLSASAFRTELQELLVLLPPIALDHEDSTLSYQDDDHPAEVSDVSMEIDAYSDESELDADLAEAPGGSGDILEEREGTRPGETSQDAELTPVLKKRSYVDGHDAVDGLKCQQQQGDVAPIKKSKTEPPDDRRRKTENVQKKKDKQHLWKSCRFQVRLFQGHNDLIGCVALDGDLLVSASRDTTLKVWSMSEGTELLSLGGHTGSVTSVLLLPETESTRIAKTYDLDVEAGRLVISGSLDCSIRVWCLNAAQHVKSIYTYSPVTCLAYIDKVGLIVSGSGGGKVELWDLETVQTVHSVHAHDDSVTCIAADKDGYIYTSAEDGTVKVFELRQRSLHLVFSSEDVKTELGSKVNWRVPRCLVVASQMVFLGDDGTNVKVLDWKLGVLHKLSNHLTEFGRTDSLSVCTDNVLLSSGYDLDYGISYVNVRDLSTERYLGTLTDSQPGRVMCLACVRSNSDGIVIITGGTELKVWMQLTDNREASASGEVVHSVQYINAYNRPVRDSDIDSDSEDSENEDDDVTPPLQNELPWRRPQQEDDMATKSGWNSWCSVL